MFHETADALPSSRHLTERISYIPHAAFMNENAVSDSVIPFEIGCIYISSHVLNVISSYSLHWQKRFPQSQKLQF